MNHQIFIASYRKDFSWLKWCLKSCQKFCKGFCDLPVVAIPLEDLTLTDQMQGLAQFVIRPDVPGRGMMSAQRAMLESDIYCPKADFIHLLGSDNFIIKPYVAEDYLVDGKPVMYRIPYSNWADTDKIDHCHVRNWQRGLRLVFHETAEFEYMNRKPNLYPKPLYALVRHQIQVYTGLLWWDYVQHAEKTLFSEQNFLGYVAERWAPHLYHFRLNPQYGGSAYKSAYVHTDQPIVAFWSWGGFDRPVSEGKAGDTPRQLIERVMGEKVE